MKHTFEILGKIFQVEIHPEDGTAKVNGSLLSYRKNPHGIFINNKFFHYDIVRDEKGKLLGFNLKGKFIPLELTQIPGKGKVKSQQGEIHAPLNGQVIEVLVQQGSHVEEGEVVLALEAMKMENEITSPVSGILQELCVKEKEIVKAGQLLFKVEPTNANP